MIAVRTLIFFVLIICGNAARADWQYTKWGMTPIEVAKASKGAVSVGNGDPKEEYDGAKIGAIGTYVSGDYQFKANFHFTDNKLVDVRLELIKGEFYALKNALLGLYGKPFDESPRLGLTTWHDISKNNRIDLLSIGSSYVMLEYRPLKNDSAAGL